MPGWFKQHWPAKVRTLDEVYGMAKVEDTEWMSRADHEGWVAVCKDDRIRTRPGERQLMSGGTLRVFRLANGNLLRAAMVDRFHSNLDAMLAQAEMPGPWLFAVYTHHIERMKLYG